MSDYDYLDANLDQRGPLSKLYTVATSDGLVFPGDLSELEHFAVFRVRERKFELSTLRTRSLPATSQSKNIFLPMPPQLQTSYGVTYNNSNIGGAGAAMLRSGGAVVDAVSDIASSDSASAAGQKIVDAGKSILGDLASNPMGALEGLGNFAARAIAESDNPVIQGAFASQNLAANPYQAVFFSNPNFRTHSFSYTLFAKNSEESETIRSIIREFKSAMLPSLALGDLFFKYPKVFEIEFRHDDYLFEIGTSVLTSFDVNYHGSGTPSYFDETKAPTNVQISMNFQEVNVLTSEKVSGEFSEVGSRR